MSDTSVTTCPTGEQCTLTKELAALKSEFQALSELVRTDTLTSLYNYRHFTVAIEQEMERSRRTGQPTALIMADIDYFKKVNDNWGHEVGNQALVLVASCLRNAIRKLDVACRYGGEEFAIIMPSTDMMTSVQVAQRLRQTIEQTPLYIDNQSLSLTISLGVGLYVGHPSDTADTLVKRADKQLYKAKEQGRNQVCYEPIGHANEQQISHDEKDALFGLFGDSEDSQ